MPHIGPKSILSSRMWSLKGNHPQQGCKKDTEVTFKVSCNTTVLRLDFRLKRAETKPKWTFWNLPGWPLLEVASIKPHCSDSERLFLRVGTTVDSDLTCKYHLATRAKTCLISFWSVCGRAGSPSHKCDGTDVCTKVPEAAVQYIQLPQGVQSNNVGTCTASTYQLQYLPGARVAPAAGLMEQNLAEGGPAAGDPWKCTLSLNQ